MKKVIVWLPLLISITLLGCSDFFSSSGEGDIDILWRKKDSPIYIDGCFIVPAGKTLFIEPGVEVRFKAERFGHNYNFLEVGMLHVKGNIIARGTRIDSIVFTRDGDEYSWAVICIDSTSTEKNIFQYCRLLHSGTLDGFFYSRDSMRNSITGSIHFHRSTGVIQDCYFGENTSGVFFYNSFDATISNNSFFNNEFDVCCEDNTTSIIEMNTFMNSIPATLTASIISYNSSPTIVNNYFNGYFYAIYCNEKSSPRIESNTLESNFYGIYCFDIINGHIINNRMKNNIYSILCLESSIQIINNLFTNNQIGIACMQQSDPYILNNTITIYGTVDSAYCGIYFWRSSHPIIYNTIVSGYEEYLDNLYESESTKVKS